ncbi:MAG TPA: hypothetical protein DHV55_00740 [Clostridiaceae bacterium]|nr:hypothetical protein [Clostridiaceae bacterium]
MKAPVAAMAWSGGKRYKSVLKKFKRDITVIEQITLSRYDKAIKDVKDRAKDLGHFLIVKEKEYKESTYKLNKLNELVEKELPEEKRHLVEELINAALWCVSVKGDFMYEQGFRDGKVLSGLIGIIQDRAFENIAL